MNPNLPVWPDTLPQDPFGDDPPKPTPQNVVKRTEVDAPIALQRRRFTARTVSYSVGPITITKEQMDTLEDFVINTLGEVKQFEWKDFRKNLPAAYRFPQGWAGVTEQYVGEDAMGTEWYEVTLALEMMP